MTTILNLPRYQQDYTPEQTEAVIRHLSKKLTPELRKMQAITNQLIELAYRKCQKDHTEANLSVLESLQVQAEHLTQAVERREFFRKGEKDYGN